MHYRGHCYFQAYLSGEMLECAVRAQGSQSTGAVPWWHTLGSWLWRAGRAGVGDRHAPRRRDTRLIVDRGLLN